METSSRAIPGVVHFDVAGVLGLVPECTVTGDFEWSLWETPE